MADVPDFIRAANEEAELRRLIESANERARLQSMQHSRTADQFGPDTAPDYVKRMGPAARFAAGMTQQTMNAWDTLRGASKEEIERRLELEKPLTRYGGTAAALGNLSGNVLQGVLAQLSLGKLGQAIPGIGRIPQATRYMLDPATVGGNITAGAVQGAFADPLDPASGALQGAAGGGFGTLAGKGAVATGTALKRALDPLREGGQAQILREYMERASGMNARDIAAAADAAPILVPGSAPTLAEATGSAAIERMTKAARTGRSSGAFNDAVIGRQADQNAARLQMLRDLAGGNSPDARAATRSMLEQARDRMSRPLRDAAVQNPSAIDTAEPISLIDRLLQGPARKRNELRNALTDVRESFFDDVEMVVDGKTVVQKMPVQDVATLYDGVRKNINDMIRKKADKAGNPLGDESIRQLTEIRGSLDDAISSSVPEFAEYLRVYSAASEPIDQLDIAERILNGSTSGSEWLGGNPTLRPDAFGSVFKDRGKKTVKGATGFSRNEGFEGELEWDQLSDLNRIRTDLNRSAAVAKGGRDVGSPTAELLAAQHVMEGTLGPFGGIGMDTSIGRAFAQGLSIPYKLTSDEIMEKLRRALIDPQYAATLLRSAPDPNAALPQFLREDFPGLFGRFSSGLAVGAP